MSDCWCDASRRLVVSVFRQDTDLDHQQHRKSNDTEGPLGKYRRTVPHRERNCSALLSGVYVEMATGPFRPYSCVLLVPLLILMAKRSCLMDIYQGFKKVAKIHARRP